MSYSSNIDHRLPKTVIPYIYRLFIDASRLDQFLFSGTVDIEMEVNEKFSIFFFSMVQTLTNVDSTTDRSNRFE